MQTRRTILKAASLTAALAAAPARAALSAKPVLILYDSRLPQSRAFAAQQNPAQTYDIAKGSATLPARAQGQMIEALTRHSDYTALRLALRLGGHRPTATRQTETGLTRWSLKPRA
jgi:hypothetical protein